MMIKRILNRIKYYIWTLIPARIWLQFSKIIEKYRLNQFSEKPMSYGALNPDLTFFVIRRRPPGNGLFSNIIHVLTGVIRANSNNYVPVVDMESYWMDEMNEVTKINETFNSWCYFFEQVSTYDLAEVYRSQNVILSRGSRILGDAHWIYDKNFNYLMNDKKISEIGEIIERFIALNNPTLSHINQIKHQLDWDSGSTLGVFVRGNTYRSGHVENDKVPDLDFIIEHISKVCRDHELKKVFISTEDYGVFSQMKQKLPRSIKFMNYRYQEITNANLLESSGRVNSDNSIRMGYYKNLNYLTEVTLISEAKVSICTVSNASTFMIARRFSKNMPTHLVLKDEIIIH